MEFELRPLKETGIIVGITFGIGYVILKGIHCATSYEDLDTYDRNMYDSHKRYIYGALWPISAGVRSLFNLATKPNDSSDPKAKECDHYDE